MRLTYHQLVGKKVIDSAGKQVGRVADVRAEDIGGELRVTGLLVGEMALLARLGLSAVRLVGRGRLPGYFVPWREVAVVSENLRLKVKKEALVQLPEVGRGVRE